jgi:regulatory protein
VSKILSEEQIIQKLEVFCAYQERCLHDVKKKMAQLGVKQSEEQFFIDYLSENNFLNEDRFVEKYIHGKLNIKKWGKHKIQQQLKTKQIKDSRIEQEIENIDKEQYIATLRNIILKKNNLLKEENPQKRKQKLINYAQQKGFEIDLIVETMKEILGK